MTSKLTSLLGAAIIMNEFFRTTPCCYRLAVELALPMKTTKKPKTPSDAGTKKSKAARPSGRKRANGKPAPFGEPRKRSQDEVLADWWWILLGADYETFRPYLGKHIAVLNKRILGSGENSIQLRESVAKKHCLDPESVVIFFVGP